MDFFLFHKYLNLSNLNVCIYQKNFPSSHFWTKKGGNSGIFFFWVNFMLRNLKLMPNVNLEIILTLKSIIQCVYSIFGYPGLGFVPWKLTISLLSFLLLLNFYAINVFDKKNPTLFTEH
jgi:hypothetical protein